MQSDSARSPLLAVSAPPPGGLVAQPFCRSQTQSFIKLLFLKGPMEPPHLSSEKCSREKKSECKIHSLVVVLLEAPALLSWIQTHDLPVFCGDSKAGAKQASPGPCTYASALAINTEESSHGGSCFSPKSPSTQAYGGPRGSIGTPAGSSSHSCVLAEAPVRPAVCRAGRKGVCMVSATLPPYCFPISALVNSWMCFRIH